MRASPGFTLLEVLAAVAVLGLVFTSLATWNIDGLRAEGRAQQRLEASLVADQVVADLEAELAAGTTPPVGRVESEIAGFPVQVEIENLELALDDPPRAPGALPASDIVDAEPTGPTLLAPPGSRRDTPLRLVRVRVGYGPEGAQEQVLRETFAVDTAAVANLAAGLEAAPGTEPGGQPDRDTRDVEGRK
jgi:prepilin-type N-terminal cleavage/methylation domain-containing protein